MEAGAGGRGFRSFCQVRWRRRARTSIRRSASSSTATSTERSYNYAKGAGLPLLPLKGQPRPIRNSPPAVDPQETGRRGRRARKEREASPDARKKNGYEDRDEDGRRGRYLVHRPKIETHQIHAKRHRPPTSSHLSPPLSLPCQPASLPPPRPLFVHAPFAISGPLPVLSVSDLAGVVRDTRGYLPRCIW